MIRSPGSSTMLTAHRRIGHGSRDAAKGKSGQAPFGRPEVVALSREISKGAGKLYGLDGSVGYLNFPARRSTRSRPGNRAG
jgi:hypothetical protein